MTLFVPFKNYKELIFILPRASLTMNGKGDTKDDLRLFDPLGLANFKDR